MNYLEHIKAWNWLIGVLDRIPDTKTRKLYKDSLLLKAIEVWGFNPEKPEKIMQTKDSPMLNESEQRLYEIIKVYNEYGIDIRTEEEKNESVQTMKDFRANMYQFVKCGGSWADVPDELRKSDYVFKEYLRAVKKVYL